MSLFNKIISTSLNNTVTVINKFKTNIYNSCTLFVENLSIDNAWYLLKNTIHELIILDMKISTSLYGFVLGIALGIKVFGVPQGLELIDN